MTAKTILLAIKPSSKCTKMEEKSIFINATNDVDFKRNFKIVKKCKFVHSHLFSHMKYIGGLEI